MEEDLKGHKKLLPPLPNLLQGKGVGEDGLGFKKSEDAAMEKI